MGSGSRLTEFALQRPRFVLRLVLGVVVLSLLGFLRLSVDTDPQNMLPSDDPVRVRNVLLADELGGLPTIVIGVFGDVESPEGFAALQRVHDALAARSDVAADSTVSVASVFNRPPQTQSEVDAIVGQVRADPLLGGNVLFERTPGAAVFVALTESSAATSVVDEAESLVSNEPALAKLEVVFGGQPLAENAFGQQMFIQMAIFAPLAGALVFALLWFFFKSLALVLPAMALAMATVLITMGSLVGSGNTLHIMSSMIPIFLMPIAILDSVHLLSEFFDRYRGDHREDLVREIVDELQRPIGYTTLTTAVGFASLALVPIPPVRVFGIFVAAGVALAWLLTMTLLPAFLITADEKRLAKITNTGATNGMPRLNKMVMSQPKLLLGVFVLAGIGTTIAALGVTVNDNPVRWFRADHEVRASTERLGAALPGTFTASFLLFEDNAGALDEPATRNGVEAFAARLRTHPEVGAVQTYVDGPHPVLRADDLANIRLQLRSGDNIAMRSVVDLAEEQLATEPIPGVTTEWAGEAYLNLTWQEKMVNGMLIGFGTTLVAIFVLLILLFRSLRWAALAMAPVLWTVAVLYGGLVLLGRDVDMPVAVLSTMVLGIGVDFAIHFVERFRQLTAEHGTTHRALDAFFGEPALAMTRNAVVIAIGFAPLVLSSLVPYVVVGVLLATIVGLSWLATVTVLPAFVGMTAKESTGAA